MATTMLDMGSKKKPVDTHKPSRMVRLPEVMAQALESMAAEQYNTLTEQVKIAVREYLERHERLPKPGTHRRH
jgi:metal-responsive CopG/Arc/MetJ family transcriptional regulator